MKCEIWVLRSRENPRRDYLCIVGELRKGLASRCGRLFTYGSAPPRAAAAGQRREMTWRDFVRAHRQSLLAVDFFMVDTIWLQRLYVLIFIELQRPDFDPTDRSLAIWLVAKITRPGPQP